MRRRDWVALRRAKYVMISAVCKPYDESQPQRSGQRPAPKPTPNAHHPCINKTYPQIIYSSAPFIIPITTKNMNNNLSFYISQSIFSQLNTRTSSSLLLFQIIPIHPSNQTIISSLLPLVFRLFLSPFLLGILHTTPFTSTITIIIIIIIILHNHNLPPNLSNPSSLWPT